MIKVRKAALFGDHAPMTAAVFHLMRTAEIEVRAVARCLGIPDPLKPAGRNWGSILAAVKAEMARRNGVNPPAWSLPDDRQFFDEAHTSLVVGTKPMTPVIVPLIEIASSLRSSQ